MAAWLYVVITLLVTVTGTLGDSVTRSEEAIVRSMLDNYEEEKIHVRPANSTTVEFGMTLASIEELDHTGSLLAVGWIKMKWNDPRLAWSAASSIKHVTFPIDHVWTPDIMQFNGLRYEQPINKDVYPIIMQNGDVLWIPPFSLAVKCVPSEAAGWEWDCRPKFGSWVYNSHQLVLREYDGEKRVVIDKDIEFPGWHVDNPEGRGVENRFYDCCPNVPYASIRFTIRLKSGSAAVTSHYYVMYAMLAVLGSLKY